MKLLKLTQKATDIVVRKGVTFPSLSMFWCSPHTRTFPKIHPEHFFFENKKFLGVGKTKFKIRGQPHLFTIELGTFFK